VPTTNNRRAGAALAAVLSLAALGAADPALAGEAEEHCYVEIIGQAEDGEYLATAPVCFDSMDDVATALGVALPAGASDAEAGGALAASSTIGVHYDGANYTGSSITVSGSDCGGGYLNLTVDWRNRISSTINGCPQVRFYNFINLGGSYEATFSSGNLGALNNAADSIQYLT